MSIYKNAVNKPITTIMVFVAVIIFGLYSLTRIPIDLYPEMEIPSLSIMTTYPGASAADIETNITKLVENAVNSVDNLKDVTSSSKDNISVVTMEFEWGSNLDEAMNDVRDAIDRVYREFPDGVDRPSIFKFSTSMMPILFYTITADESFLGLAKLIEEKVVNPLNRIDGVASVFLSGAPERTIYVNVDPKKLDALNLSVEGVGQIIAASNLNMPSGNVKMGQLDYQLRVQGEFESSDEIANLAIANNAGRTVYVRDVATIIDTIKDLSLLEKSNGKRGMRLMVMKQSGANTVGVAKSVNEELTKLTQALPPDIKLVQVFDSSTFIKNSVGNLSDTLLFALLFVCLVILFFLGRWRATFIIVLTIPISLIVAFTYLFVIGSSVNIIALSSISIALGMVVDDAIVVLENITKHIERGGRPRESAIYATNEVWVSVLVTTLVVVAVFMPLTFLEGMVGILFQELGWIVSITVVTSTLAAITLTPMLCAYMLKVREESKRLRGFAFFHKKYIEKYLDAFDRFYARTLAWSLAHKRIVVPVIGLFFIASMFLFKFIETDFMPQTDESRFAATVELATGTRVEETDKITVKIEDVIRERYPEVTIISSSAGADDEGGFSSLFGNNATNLISFTIKTVELKDRKRSVFEIQDDFRKQLAAMPEIVEFSVTNGGGGFGGGGNTVDVEIFGYDLNATSLLAEQIRAKANQIKGVGDVQVSRKKDRPELKVVLDKEKLSKHGLNVASVSTAVRNRVGGLMATRFREDGEEYDVIVRLDESYRNAVSNINDLSFSTPTGKTIKFSEVAKIEEYWGPPNIERKRRERLVTVKITPSASALGTVAKEIGKEIAEMQVPQGVMINIGGAYEDQQESFADMGLLMLLIISLVFIVMASQFESFSKPFVIMFAIPFAFTGVAIALVLTNTTLNMIASLGAILLIGIVIKNGIVLVDFINLMRDRGYELTEAITIAGKSRLRPVLMTTATTILGMLPMALSVGEGAEIWSPMGITVIGGLTVSTIITLIIVPVMYALVARHGERDKQKAIRKDFEFLDN